MRKTKNEKLKPSDPQEKDLLRVSEKYLERQLAAVALERAAAVQGVLATSYPQSGNIQDDKEDERPFSLPGESVASRKVTTGTRGAFSVQILNWGSRKISCESFTEFLAVRTMLALRPDVIEVEEQLPPIPYTDDNGRQRQHFFDFRITMADGRRVAVAVKSEARARRGGFRKVLRQIGRATPKSVADGILLITDQMIPAELRSFASAVESARADIVHRPAEAASDDAAAEKVIATMAGAWTIGHLLRAIALPDGRGLRAIIRAIASGRLSMPDGYRLDEAEFVRSQALTRISSAAAKGLRAA